MSDIQTEYLEGRMFELSDANIGLSARVRELEGAIRAHKIGVDKYGNTEMVNEIDAILHSHLGEVNK